MGLRINTNLPAIAAQRSLSRTQRDLERVSKQLASGNRFADLTEGAGDFAIAEHLKAQIKGQRAAQFNAENAISFVQIAEGGLNEQNNILIRLRELAVQSASDTFSEQERELLNYEYTQLVQELDRVAQTTRFGSTKLLAGDNKTFEFQIGSYGTSNDIVKFSSDTNTTASELDISGTSISDKGDARDQLETLDEALFKMSQARAKFGAVQSRLESVVNNSGVLVENLEAARSRIADTDVAKAAADFSKQQILQQYQTAVLAQANQFPLGLMRLVG